MNLLPHKATPFERAMANSVARISDIPVPLRDLWNPQKCPVNLLPWLAWALSVDEWDTNWTEQQKRNVITASVEVHRQKGTIGAVRKALEPFGLGNAIQEWWQTEPCGKPHTFKLSLAFIVTPADIQDSIAATLRRVKPVRSQMLIELVVGFLGQINVIGILRVCTFHRISAHAIY